MPRRLADLSEASAVQAALDEHLQAGQQVFLRDHGDGRASADLVRDARSGQWADSNANAGVALGHRFPADGLPRAGQFSGGITTGERTPFCVSATEARFARDHRDSFRLYRLFDVHSAPRPFERAGAIEQHGLLDAAGFRASFG